MKQITKCYVKFKQKKKEKKFFDFQCVIAEGNSGIMVLLKRSFLINIINEHRDANVKVTVRFFNLEDSVIHTTEKTEIEINTTVNILFLIKKILN